MKHIIKTIFLSFLFLNTPLFGIIDNTKHNLSVTGPGTVKAQSETEVCVFCHIPHRASEVGKPLWNRSMPTSTYTMYNSDYLKRMNYPVDDPTYSNLGTLNDTPGALSRQCMSCHDGTVAIGAVHVLRTATDQTISMTGVETDGTMLSSAAGFIGTDLTKHHPVGILYDPSVTKIFGDGSTRTMELKTSPDGPVKVFNYSANNYVECSSCHDPHTENDKFLIVDSGANLAQNIAITCTSCHQKTNWIGTIHETPPSDSLYTDTTVIEKYGTNKMADLSCANCHIPHNGEGTPYILRKTAGNTCFVGASNDSSTATCHGVGGYKDIESLLSRSISHPAVASDNPDGSHTNLDVLYGEDTPVDSDGGKGVAWSNNKHAVCMDCHNPHKAKKGTHVTDGTWYGTPNANSNNVSPTLEGVTGIEPVWPTEWLQPISFTTKESSTKEYQICFKCHSYYGLGNTLSASNPATSYPSISDPFNVAMTDVAWEMNINNKSGHPVVVSANSRTGSYAPKAIPAAALLSPWNSNPGGNTMYCSDCHGADDELGGDPRGPHGSDLKFMLKGENKYWPTKPDGLTLYDTNDIGTAGDTGLFCKNCHDLNEPHKNQWTWRMTNRNFDCVECHVAVPHGSPISRLIGYDTFPSPYNYEGNSLRTTRYIKNSVTNSNDVAGSGCGGGMCHGGNSVPGYDANLMP